MDALGTTTSNHIGSPSVASSKVAGTASSNNANTTSPKGKQLTSTLSKTRFFADHNNQATSVGTTKLNEKSPKPNNYGGDKSTTSQLKVQLQGSKGPRAINSASFANHEQSIIDKVSSIQNGGQQSPLSQPTQVASIGQNNPVNRFTLNLKECRYNLFQQLALTEFNWRVIAPGNEHLVTPQTYQQYQDIQRKIKSQTQEQQKEWQDQQNQLIQQQLQKQQKTIQAEQARKAEDSNSQQRDQQNIETTIDDAASQKENQEESPVLPQQRRQTVTNSAASGIKAARIGSTQLPAVERNSSLVGGRGGGMIRLESMTQAKSPTADRRVQRFTAQTLVRNQNNNQFAQQLPQLASISGGAMPQSHQYNQALNNMAFVPQIEDELLSQLSYFQPGNPKDLSNWEICWQDFGITPEFLSQLQPFQRVNHFLGMYNIARKNTLSIHLKRFQKEFPEQYDFFPQTWLYPQDLHEISEYNAKRLNKRKAKLLSGEMTEQEAEKEPPVLYIAKPEAGCQGRGIFISANFDQMKQKLDTNVKKHQKDYEEYLRQEEQHDTAQNYAKETSGTNAAPGYMTNTVTNNDAGVQQAPVQFDKSQASYVIQKYLNQPALWTGHKYDFRIYVLVTSVIDPMTIFLYKDGLVRLASEKYDPSKNFNDPYTHLTNYSLNKKNDKFDNDAHKLRLNDCLKGIMTQPPVKKGKPGATKSAADIWDEIEAIIVKTIITVQPQLQHIYRSCQAKEPDCCFELLGFDIMLDQKLKPWMLEVNHTPSFGADTQTDEAVKRGLIRNTLEIIQMSVEHRKKIANELKQEMKDQIAQNLYKRPTVMEHQQRVRFDPEQVIKKLGRSNKYKLIYPRESSGAMDSDLYYKFQRKANSIWQKATGTVTNMDKRRDILKIANDDKPKKPKKKKKKALPKDSTDPNAAGSNVNEEAANDEAKRNGKNKDGEVDNMKPPNTVANSTVQGFNIVPHIGEEEEGEAEQIQMDTLENDSPNEYNFLEKNGQAKMYKSMQKTIHSDEKDADDHTNYPNGLEHNNGMNLKVYSHHKPQRHLSALHSTTTSSNQLHHTPQCMASGANCHLRHGLFPDSANNVGINIRDKRHTTNGQAMLTPCMQALQQQLNMQGQAINQISHSKGGVPNPHSYNSTSSHGFGPNIQNNTSQHGGSAYHQQIGPQQNQRVINPNSFKSQQPTQSSKAKQVHAQNNRKNKEQSYSLQQDMHYGGGPFAEQQATSQIQLPFPIQTYTKHQLEKMGIPPSTFHNLPLMTQSEIQQHLKQQLRDEFAKRNGLNIFHQSKQSLQNNPNQQQQQQQPQAANRVPINSVQAQQSTQYVSYSNQKGQQVQVGMKPGQQIIHPAQQQPVNFTEFKQNVINQLSHLNGQGGSTLYQITRKQKEQLEFLLTQGQLPNDMQDDKTVADLFNALTDENGSM